MKVGFSFHRMWHPTTNIITFGAVPAADSSLRDILAYGLKTRKGSSAEHILISLGERQLVSPGSILHCLCLSRKH